MKRKQHSVDHNDLVLLWDWQDGLCLCGDPIDVDKAHVDHDHACCHGNHSCGRCVRGVLHRGCNTALGQHEALEGQITTRHLDGKHLTLRELDYLARYARRGGYTRIDTRTPNEKLADNTQRRPRLDVVCTRGHARTPENIYEPPNGNRVCRPCKNLNSKAYRRHLSTKEYINNG